jgi:recombination protein RecA
MDYLKKSGNTYIFGENKLGVGRENAKQFLKQNPEVLETIKQGVWNKVHELEATR